MPHEEGPRGTRLDGFRVSRAVRASAPGGRTWCESGVLCTLLRVLMLVIVALGTMGLGTAAASPRRATKLVRYRGLRMVVPATWPVYDLTRHPNVCVRFDRHAVYLGRPNANQRCPAHAVGRVEAILVAPLSAHAARSDGGAGALLPAVSNPGAQLETGSSAQVVMPARGVVLTVAWGRHPGLVEQALGVHSLAATTTTTGIAPSPGARSLGARSARAAAVPGGVYTGLGFDPCSAPSPSQMSAWGASPYRAVGIYIGGTNMGCSQPNLTAGWVSAEAAAGWHLIPTYVGLQAPGNSCGCAPITPARASAEGAASAADAVTQAGALRIGPGNPIYFDMESYTRGAGNTPAVLKFLAAWTSQLHADGYTSGVYSSAGSGISDLVAKVGTGYGEPDDIWIAHWNGLRTTADPYVPSSDWPSHQRLHQYSGGHNETYGRVTLNIDGDYLDGATAGATSTPTVAATPTLSVSPAGDGTIHLHASWPGMAGISAWRVLAGANPGTLTPVSGPAKHAGRVAITVRSAYPYFAVQALGSTGQLLGSSPPVATPPYIAIYGHGAFVSSTGVGSIPAGCFTLNPCLITTTISVGRKRIASTGRESIGEGTGALLDFKLSPAGRAMLARSRGARLAAHVVSHDVSGARATTTLNLIPFFATALPPRRGAANTRTLRIIGLASFVSGGGFGGILAGCFDSAPCHVHTTVATGRTTIARTGPEILGVNELGYLIFKLTPQGSSLLARAPGNQIAAHASITDANAIAHVTIALVKFR